MIINTFNYEKDQTFENINNVGSDSNSNRSNSYIVNCTSDRYEKSQEKKKCRTKSPIYCLCIDWFQLVVELPENFSMLINRDENIHIEEVLHHFNPNYKKCYNINYYGENVCTIYTNSIRDFKESLLKVSNPLLYSTECYDIISSLINKLDMKVIRLNRIDIALDGVENIKVLEYCNKYVYRKTIRLANEHIQILPLKFLKRDLSFMAFEIGSKSSGKTVRIYNKTDELRTSGKSYISDYWKANSLETSKDVVRFELQLGYKHLKKYLFDPLVLLRRHEINGQIFTAEVQNWLQFYRVKLKDLPQISTDQDTEVENHASKYKKQAIKGKFRAIARGKEIKYIKWDHIPKSESKLDIVEYPTNSIFNIKRSITTAINQVANNSEYVSDYTNISLQYIEKTMTTHNLETHTFSKIYQVLKNIDNIHDHPLYKYFNLDLRIGTSYLQR